MKILKLLRWLKNVIDQKINEIEDEQALNYSGEIGRKSTKKARKQVAILLATKK